MHFYLKLPAKTRVQKENTKYYCFKVQKGAEVCVSIQDSLRATLLNREEGAVRSTGIRVH